MEHQLEAVALVLAVGWLLLQWLGCLSPWARCLTLDNRPTHMSPTHIAYVYAFSQNELILASVVDGMHDAIQALLKCVRFLPRKRLEFVARLYTPPPPSTPMQRWYLF